MKVYQSSNSIKKHPMDLPLGVICNDDMIIAIETDANKKPRITHSLTNGDICFQANNQNLVFS